MALTFEVTTDEEYVHLRMTESGQVIDMGARGHNYLLLTLARRRIADTKAGHPDSNCGWIYRDELTRDPTMPPQALNIHVHRIRRQFARTLVVDPAEIVERRRVTHQLRIGTANLRIVPC